MSSFRKRNLRSVHLRECRGSLAFITYAAGRSGAGRRSTAVHLRSALHQVRDCLDGLGGVVVALRLRARSLEPTFVFSGDASRGTSVGIIFRFWPIVGLEAGRGPCTREHNPQAVDFPSALHALQQDVRWSRCSRRALSRHSAQPYKRKAAQRRSTFDPEGS